MENKRTYCLGSYSCIELLKSKKALITKCIVQNKYKNNEGEEILFKLLPDNIKVVEDNKLLKKISFKENIYVALEFIPYEMEYDNSPIVVIKQNDEGTLGSIIRSAVAFSFYNIAIISKEIDIFSTKLLRASMGSFYKANIKIFPSIDEIKNKYKNKIIELKEDDKIPYHVISSINLYKLRKIKN